MIKTFISKSPEEVDQLCNNFMRDKGKSMPVRTESYAVPNNDSGATVYHKAVVFYDEPKEPEIQATHTGSMFTDPIKKKSDDKLGAIWKRANGELSGVIEKTPFVFTEALRNSMNATKTKSGEDMLVGEIYDKQVRILKNKFKTMPKHPDYIIFKAQNV